MWFDLIVLLYLISIINIDSHIVQKFSRLSNSSLSFTLILSKFPQQLHWKAVF